MSWTFVAPSLSRPAGGLIAMFAIANELAARSDTGVRIVHLPTPEARLDSVSALPWFEFDRDVEHIFSTDFDPEVMPDADVVVFAPMLLVVARSPDAAPHGGQLVSMLHERDGRLGLPVLFLQGLNVFPADVEDAAIRMPGPKVCVGSWLVDELLRRGVSSEQVHHIPNGVDHRMFRVMEPIRSRTAQVAMNFDLHRFKGGETGMNALAALHDAVGTPSIAFGTRPPERPAGSGTKFMLSPVQASLARDIYNASSVYLQPSVHEGFGMCAVEAMACGCALVSTDNGGSSDYALDGETALVCDNDAQAMCEAMRRLVRDDDLRTRIAASGAAWVRRFRWSVSADGFERLAFDHVKS